MASVMSSRRHILSPGYVIIISLIISHLMPTLMVSGFAVLSRKGDTGHFNAQLDEEFLRLINETFADWFYSDHDPDNFHEPPVMDRITEPTFPPADEWSSWSNCVSGAQTRSRVPGADDSSGCGITSCFQTRICSTTSEPSSPPQWGHWGPWSTCVTDHLTGNSLAARTRKCLNQSPSSTPNLDYGFQRISTPSETCQGMGYETQTCSHDAEPVLSSWTPWGICDSVGHQYRRRQCLSDDCQNAQLTEVRVCQATENWTEWGAWSSCSNKYRERHRTCQRVPCHGSTSQTIQCIKDDSGEPDQAQWSSWSSWGLCVSGRQTRSRSCLGAPCFGLPTETIVCEQPGYEPTGWTTWGEWSDCDDGKQVRTRYCRRGEKCPGSSYETQTCPDIHPATTTDSEWSDWSPCYGLAQFRFRGCPVQFVPCPTSVYQTRNCSPYQPITHSDPWWLPSTDRAWRPDVQASAWSEWSDWSPCVDGLSKRFRACSGDQCPGCSEETKVCKDTYGWEEWGAWDQHCQYGKRWRHRECSPDPARLGQCVGPNADSQPC